jgi:hypothetical protein
MDLAKVRLPCETWSAGKLETQVRLILEEFSVLQLTWSRTASGWLIQGLKARLPGFD